VTTPPAEGGGFRSNAIWQLINLVVAPDWRAVFPCADTLFQTSVVQLSTHVECGGQLVSLFTVGIEPKLESLSGQWSEFGVLLVYAIVK
jgi:hypothetical protein